MKKKDNFFSYVADKYKVSDATLYNLLGWDRRRYWQREYWNIRCGDVLALAKGLELSPTTIFKHWVEWSEK